MIVRRRLHELARDERGLGLIELLAVLAILGTVVGMITTLFVGAMRSEVDLSERVQAQEQARLALETLRRDIHEACRIDPATASSVTLIMPAVPDPSADPDFCATGTAPLTWCMRGASQRYTLHRVSGDSALCAGGGGVRWADFITQPDVFEYIPETPSSLALLRVDLPVDLRPADTLRAYRLRDALALRNSRRQ